MRRHPPAGPRHRGRMDHQVVGVMGASGGLGASSLAVAIAVRAASRWGATAAIDGPGGFGGLDVTACVEHLPGVRWPDLAASQGSVDGAAVLRALPALGGVHVLGARGVVPEPGVVSAVVEALAGLCAVTVLDLGRDLGLVRWCTDLLLMAGGSARQLADAAALAPLLHDAAPGARLVLRTGRRDPVLPEDIADSLDLPLAAVLADDARAATDADRARPPGERDGSALARAADAVLAGLTPAAIPVVGAAP